jgi:hypothetical protein
MTSKNRRNRRRAAHECAGKIRYERKSEAINRAVVMSKKHGRPLEPYQCRQCYGFHIGKARMNQEVQNPKFEDVKEVADHVEEAMELIRDNHYLTDAVTKQESIEFLSYLMSRIDDLKDELQTELLKEQKKEALEKNKEELKNFSGKMRFNDE